MYWGEHNTTTTYFLCLPYYQHSCKTIHGNTTLILFLILIVFQQNQNRFNPTTKSKFLNFIAAKEPNYTDQQIDNIWALTVVTLPALEEPMICIRGGSIHWDWIILGIMNCNEAHCTNTNYYAGPLPTKGTQSTGLLAAPCSTVFVYLSLRFSKQTRNERFLLKILQSWPDHLVKGMYEQMIK